VNVISNGVNLDTYHPINKQKARQILGLPIEDTLFLWAAGGKGNYRKGYHLAVAAMQEIQNQQDGTGLVTMAANQGWDEAEKLARVFHLGFIPEAEKQALVYSAADAFLCTTLADGQPQTALESLACGTPVIAFNLGPMPEIVIPGKTGYLAGSPGSSDLLEAIQYFLKDTESQSQLQAGCRKHAVKKYDLRKQTQRYIDLYEKILD
jgi:glycosyltransferase involved in cell wall biosynthesis